eukprot:Selendium_serpulae@DN7066_c0_g1_i2.p1
MRVSPSDVWSFKLALLKDDSSISVTNPLKLDLEESAWDWSTEFSIRGVQFDHELSRTSSYVWLANFWHPKITMEIEVENGHLESVAGDTNALALMAISHDLVELETHSIVLNEKNFDLTITFILCKDEQTQGGRIALLRGFNGMPMIPQNGSFSRLIVRAFMWVLSKNSISKAHERKGDSCNAQEWNLVCWHPAQLWAPTQRSLLPQQSMWIVLKSHRGMSSSWQ